MSATAIAPGADDTILRANQCVRILGAWSEGVPIRLIKTYLRANILRSLADGIDTRLYRHFLADIINTLSTGNSQKRQA